MATFWKLKSPSLGSGSSQRDGNGVKTTRSLRQMGAILSARVFVHMHRYGHMYMYLCVCVCISPL